MNTLYHSIYQNLSFIEHTFSFSKVLVKNILLIIWIDFTGMTINVAIKIIENELKNKNINSIKIILSQNEVLIEQ